MFDQWDNVASVRDRELVAHAPEKAHAELLSATLGMPFALDPDLVPVRPVVLAQDLRDSLGAASARLVELIHRVAWSLTSDPEELVGRTGLDRSRLPLLGLCGDDAERTLSAALARPDVLISNGKPLFVECNFGTADAGLAMSHHLLRAYRGLYDVAGDRASAPGEHEPYAGRARLFARLCDERDLPRTVAVLGTMRELVIGHRRYFDAEVDYLRDRGFTAEFVEPEEFAANRDPDRWSLVSNHFISAEWQEMGISLDEVRRARGNALFVGPESMMSLSSKIFFAWLSSGAVELSPQDAEFVAEHVPWTRHLHTGSAEFEGRDVKLVDLLTNEREQFVLKPIGEWAGRGVLLGHGTAADEWAALVRSAAEAGTHVVQRLVIPDPLAVDYLDVPAGEVRRLPVSYVLGPFVADGVPCGCAIRHLPSDGAAVVGYRRGAANNLTL